MPFPRQLCRPSAVWDFLADQQSLLFHLEEIRITWKDCKRQSDTAYHQLVRSHTRWRLEAGRTNGRHDIVLVGPVAGYTNRAHVDSVLKEGNALRKKLDAARHDSPEGAHRTGEEFDLTEGVKAWLGIKEIRLKADIENAPFP